MTIDFLYNNIDKNNYYIGKISQVYRDNSIAQVENLSLLSHRKLLQESLVPNTINYLVVIDSVHGIFLGQVFQNKISSSDKLYNQKNSENYSMIFPEISIDIIGIMKHGDKKFRLSEFMTVGISEKVYLANREVVRKYLDSIEITNSSENQLSPFATFLDINNENVLLKPSTLFDHHLFVVGTTNSGKSTSALSILDKIICDNKKALIIDPTGEYKESFPESNVEKLNLGIDTNISPGKLSMQQWAMVFETNSNTQSAVLSEAIKSLRYQKKIGIDTSLIKHGENIINMQQNLAKLDHSNMDFNILLLPEQIINESVLESRNGIYEYDTFKANSNSYLVQKITYQFSNSNFLKFFNTNSTLYDLLDKIESFIHTANTSLYINTSSIGATDGIGGMIIDLICNYIMSQENIIPFVLFIDEVHRYTKSEYSDGEFYNGLTLVAREGRKKGVFLFLTSQNPKDISPILLGQIGTLLIHRLTHNDEINTIKNYLDDYSIKRVNRLNQGEAIMTSVNLMQNIFINTIKCNRKQDNITPLL